VEFEYWKCTDETIAGLVVAIALVITAWTLGPHPYKPTDVFRVGQANIHVHAAALDVPVRALTVECAFPPHIGVIL
jgi:hypothetical protein